MILDSKSRKLLKLITSEKPPETTRLFTFDYVMNKLNISRDEAFACIRYLDTLGYIECTYKNIGFNFLLGFRASHKGYNYAEFWRLQLLEEILKSVLLPVVVSIITSLLIVA